MRHREDKRLRSAALLALAASACGDPSIDVSFSVPPAYRELVAEVRLRVLEPQASAPFGCDEVTFGLVDDDAIELSSTLEIALDGTDAESALSGVPREGDKLFLAEGLDDGGARVVAACAARGTIDGDEAVALAGEPSSFLEVLGQSSSGIAPAPQLPADIEIGLFDAFGEPLAAREVRWQVIGPADERGVRASGLAGADGLLTASVEPTSLVGPALVQVSPRWPSEENSPLHFVQPFAKAVEPQPLPTIGGTSGDYAPTRAPVQFGRLGPRGEMGFAVLGPTEPEGRVLRLGYFDATEATLFRASDLAFSLDDYAPEEIPTALGIVARDGSERVVALSASLWYELDSGAQLIDSGPLSFDAPPAFAVAAGACDGSGAELLVEVGSEGEGLELFVLDPLDPREPYALARSGPFVGLSGLAPVGSGCVLDADDYETRQRLIALTPAESGESNLCEGETLALVSDLDGGRSLCLAGGEVLPTAGFSALAGEPAVLLPSIGLDGYGVGLFLVGRDDGDARDPSLYLQFVDRHATVLPALATAAGDFDADGELDLVASTIAEETDTGFEQLLRVGLALDYGGERLEAFLDEQEGPLPALWTGDLDGDGYDDLLAVSSNAWAAALFGKASP